MPLLVPHVDHAEVGIRPGNLGIQSKHSPKGALCLAQVPLRSAVSPSVNSSRGFWLLVGAVLPVCAFWCPPPATAAFSTSCASAREVSKGVNKYVSNNVDTRENFSFDPVAMLDSRFTLL